MRRCGALLLFAFFGGCAFSSSHSDVESTATATVIINGTGAALSPSVGIITLRCDPEGGARVELKGRLTSTSTGQVSVSASACGSVHQVLGTVGSSAFASASASSSAEAKFEADYAMPLRLGPTGTHALVLCFVQEAGNGTGNFVCSESFDLESLCDEPAVPGEETPGGTIPVGDKSCADAALFGGLVGSPSLCTGKGDVHIPVHARGSFGEVPELTITGPSGYEHRAVMKHSGESCNYQYTWDASQNGGAGDYTFAITGARQTHSFTRALSCP